MADYFDMFIFDYFQKSTSDSISQFCNIIYSQFRYISYMRLIIEKPIVKD